MNDNRYNEVLLDHNLHPLHRCTLDCATCSCAGINPSCGDQLTLHLVLEDNTITDGSFTGVGCAVSQASTDIMLDLIIGKTISQAKHIHNLFAKMIGEEISQEELEELQEAVALRNISKMPARVKCAMLGWNTLGKMLDENQ